APPGQDPVFAGHFPGLPVFPGVYLVERVHRAVFAALAKENRSAELVGIERCRLVRPVHPGDQIDIELQFTSDSDDLQCTATAATGRGPVATVRLRYRESAARYAPTGTGVADIKRIIPHRFPILLVDRVTEVVPGDRLTAVKAVTCNEPCYAEADGDYAYPAELLVESWGQAAVLLACWEQPNPDVLQGKVELAGAIEGVRFGAPAYPGDVLEHQVRMVRSVGDTAIVEGHTTAADRGTVLEVGRFVLALRDVDVLEGTHVR
ncbi:MAG: hypothetical protein IRY90_10630, partial [Actinomadura rubrobrunea]|nr:hypothetical protein [Actinomadura rubrobrunea]